MDRQAIVVSGPVGSGAATFAREIAQRIGGVRRKCTWSELVTPTGPRVLRDRPAVLIVEGLPDSHLARDLAAVNVAKRDPQLIFVTRSAHVFASHPAFAVVQVERQAQAERKPKAKHTPQFHLSVAGMASAFELTLRFIAWAAELKGEPTALQIRERWEVSRATSYRWMRAWQDAKGVLTA